MDAGPPWPSSPDGLVPKAQHPPIVPVWPRPSAGSLSQATVSRLFIFKIPVVFLPVPKEQCQPQRACGLGSGPEAPGGASGHPAAAGQFWEGFEASCPAEEAQECPDFKPEALTVVLSGRTGAH